MSPSTIEQPQADERRILQPVQLPRRRRSFLGYVIRYTRRGMAYAAYALAVLLAWIIVSPVLPSKYAFPPQLSSGSSTAAPKATTTVPPRPKSAPAHIPGWAWSMQQWFNKPAASRGPRPKAAPTRLPKWFWAWRKWHLALEQH